MNDVKINSESLRCLLVFVLMLYFAKALPQNASDDFEVKGIVTDSDDNSLSSVIITINNQTPSSYTTATGEFKINVSKLDTLVFSHPEFVSKTFIVSEAKDIAITLQRELIQKRPVNVAFGTYKNSTLPAAISTINETEVRKNAVNTIEQALNGTLSGLSSIKNGSEKFGLSNYNFYVRGVATTGNSRPLILVDGVDANINLLDPNEIESITVLKDASELALYGMRGANGVILITTKTGKPSEQFMNVEVRTGVQSPLWVSDKLNAFEYTSLFNEARLSDGNSPTFNPDDYNGAFNPKIYPDNNLPDQFLRKQNEHLYQNLIFSTGGGNAIAQYFTSVSYMKQGGLFTVPLDLGEANQTANERYNFRSNIDVNLGKGFVLNTKVAAISDVRRSPWLGRNSNVAQTNNSIFNSIMNTPANAYPVTNLDGSLGGTSEFQNNLLGVLNSGRRVETARQLTVKAKLSKDLSSLLKGLSVNAVYNFENYNAYYEGRFKGFSVFQLNEDGTYDEYGVEDNSTSISGGQMSDFYKDETIFMGLDYANEFNDHKLDASFTSSQYTSQISGDNPVFKLLGVSGRVSYGYRNKYQLQLSGAYQGSNDFASGNRFGFFPAASLAWVVSEENFLKSSDFIQHLKIRSSYGLTGNYLGGSRFLYRQPYSVSTGYGFGNPNGFVPGTAEGRLSNPNATWETAYKANIGLDATLFKEALRLSVDVFDEDRKDILIPQANLVTDLIGISLPQFNAGNVTNRGVEVALNYTQDIGLLNLSVGGNVMKIDNNVVDLSEVAYPEQEDYRYLRGNAIDSRFGLVAEGIYNSQEEIQADNVTSAYGSLKPGDIRYMDLNGDGIINDADKKAIGNFLPEIIYGINFALDYKGFDLYLLGEGSAGFDVHARPDQFSVYSYENRWTSSNGMSSSTTPRVSLTSDHNQQVSTFWQEKGNLFRLASAEMGYTLTQDYLRNTSLSSLRIFLNANNLLSTSTAREGRDFEAINAGYTQYPIFKTVLLGVKVNL